MAKIQSRQQLKEFCLRAIGAPVLLINVDDNQLEDRIDDALDLFWEYHTDGSELTWMHHQVTSSEIDAGVITLPDEVRSIVSVIGPGNGSQGGANGIATINLQYQMYITDIMNVRKIMQGGLGTFYITQSYLNMISDTFSAESRLTFNHLHNKLRILDDWAMFKEGDWVGIECYTIVDPEVVKDAYNDRWLKQYCTALFKRQWGWNLIKFPNVTLPGGVTVNAEQIYNEGKEDVTRLEEELQTHYQDPPDFFIG